MLSARQLPQPNPSYPALCRQDTTYAWGTDFGGNRLRGARATWHGADVDDDSSRIRLYIPGVALVVLVLIVGPLVLYVCA